jgi:hypothetical protein
MLVGITDFNTETLVTVTRRQATSSSIRTEGVVATKAL